MRFKHALACPRPVHISPQVQPIITTPLHSTYPMGHAAQAYMAAHALQKLLGWDNAHPGTVQLQRQAERISINRVVAGVHFPVDALAGQRLGQTLGEYFVMRSALPGCDKWKPRSLDRDAMKDIPGSPEALEFVPDALAQPSGSSAAPTAKPKVLQAMARLARAEWHANTEQRIPQQP
jgi:hypothetical protein